MPICQSIIDLIGRTPMLRIPCESGAEIYAKLESFNPGGSVKDRIAWAMIRRAEERGEILPGATIIEPTSGSTGIGLAMIAAARGYRAIIVMPDTMSMERQMLLRAYGAQVVLTPGSQGMQGAVAKAEELASQTPGSFIPGQFDNPDNPEAHALTTGPEIWADMAGRVDVLVACIGTGGTITGTGRYLKAKNPAVRIIGVEPSESPLLSQGHAGSHGIQGIGANFVPEALDLSVVDEVITVSTEAAMAHGRDLARCQGVLVGISSGAAMAAALEVAKRPAYDGKRIAVILPDTGERYLSTAMFSESPNA